MAKTKSATKATKKTSLAKAPYSAKNPKLVFVQKPGVKREKKVLSFKAMVDNELAENKGDVLMNTLIFCETNRKQLITSEIYELMLAGLVTHVHEDNSHSVMHDGKGLRIELHDEETKVLCIPHDVSYLEWSEFFGQQTL